MTYHENIAKYYDITRDLMFDYDAEALNLGKIFKEKNVKSILDVACGTGKHLIRLAKMGYDCTGIDLSNDMLEVAREKALKEGLNISYIQGDARDFRLNKKFDAITFLYTSSFLPNVDDIRKALKIIRNSLNSGGMFIANFMNIKFRPPGPPIIPQTIGKMEGLPSNPPPILSPLLCDTRDFIEREGLKIVRMSHYHRPAENIEIWTAIHLVEDHGKTSFFIHKQREILLSFDEVKALVENNGFKIESVYDDLSNLNEFTGETIGFFIIAHKST